LFIFSKRHGDLSILSQDCQSLILDFLTEEDRNRVACVSQALKEIEEKSHVQKSECQLTNDHMEQYLNGTLGSNHHRHLVQCIYQSTSQDIQSLDPSLVFRFMKLKSPSVALAFVRQGLLLSQDRFIPDVFMDAIKDKELHPIAWELQLQEEKMRFVQWDGKNLIFAMSWTEKGYKLPLRKTDGPEIQFIRKYLLNYFDAHNLIHSLYFLDRPDYQKEVIHAIGKPEWMDRLTGRLDKAPWLNLLIRKASPYVLASLFVSYYDAFEIPLDLTLSNAELMDGSVKTLPNKSNIKQQFQWSLLLWTYREKLDQAVQYVINQRPESVTEIVSILDDMSRGEAGSPKKGHIVRFYWTSVAAAASGHQESFGREWFLKEQNIALRQALIMVAAAQCQYSFVKNQVQKWSQPLLIHSIYALSIAPKVNDQCQTLMDYLYSKLSPRGPQEKSLLVSIGFNLIQLDRYELFLTMASILSPLPGVQQVAIAERRDSFVYKIMDVLVNEHTAREQRAFYQLLRREKAVGYQLIFLEMVPGL
jgi:hypothetical protein